MFFDIIMKYIMITVNLFLLFIIVMITSWYIFALKQAGQHLRVDKSLRVDPPLRVAQPLRIAQTLRVDSPLSINAILGIDTTCAWIHLRIHFYRKIHLCTYRLLCPSLPLYSFTVRTLCFKTFIFNYQSFNLSLLQTTVRFKIHECSFAVISGD